MKLSRAPAAAEETYRCTGCGARWSYEAVRYIALCPECASGLVRVVESPGRRRSGQTAPRPRTGSSGGEVAPQAPAQP
jgi:DNA-directed RNA polymerase subunit RPC12/RpoP